MEPVEKASEGRRSYSTPEGGLAMIRDDESSARALGWTFVSAGLTSGCDRHGVTPETSVVTAQMTSGDENSEAEN